MKHDANPENFHGGFTKTLSSFCPRKLYLPYFEQYIKAHTKNCQLTPSSNIVSTNLSEPHLSFKFTQVKKSDSYKIISQLTFIIKHSLEYYI